MMPISHLNDAMLLEGDGRIHLYEIRLATSLNVYLKRFSTGTWQGKTYGAIEISMSEVKRNSDGEAARPTLQIVNPEGLFTLSVLNGDWDMAPVTRHTVLRTNFENNVPIAVTERWFISRVTQCDHNTVAFELRSPADRMNAVIPVRTFSPPDFPFVNLR